MGSNTVRVRIPVGEALTSLKPGDRVLVRSRRGDTWDYATVGGISAKPIRRGRDRDAEPVATRYEIRTHSDFGWESTHQRFATEADVWAAFPQSDTDPEGKTERARETALAVAREVAEQRVRYLAAFEGDTRLVVEDPDSEDEVEVTPAWGSRMNLTMFAPDVDAETLRATVEEAVKALYPDARLHNVKSRPVADQRVDVLTVGGDPLAYNVLEDEAAYYANSNGFSTRYVDPRVPQGR